MVSKSSNGAKNILILGSDTWEDAGRADTIMVLQQMDHQKPKLISFMRDTFVDIHGVE